MKSIFIISILSIFSIANSQVSVVADSIVGEWYTPDKRALVTIYETNGIYHGEIVDLKNPTNKNGEPLKDVRNKKRALRDREVVGIKVLKNFKFKRRNKWSGGVLYSPLRGKSYSGILKMKDPNTLAVRGYMGTPSFGKTVIWKRKR